MSPEEYFEKRVFDDKPGVGWMLYLPKVITTQQVPEAHALTPVPEAGRKQTGTIIVSVTDAMFSVDNPGKGGMVAFNRHRRTTKAGKLRRASPHWMGHTHATHALARGAELTTVRDNLRHSSISTTSIYLHSDEVKRAQQMAGAFGAGK